MARSHPPNPARNNGLFIAPGFGLMPIPVVRLEHGIDLDSDAQEVHAREKQTRYTTRVNIDSFGVTLRYADREEYLRMTFWLTLWGAQLISQSSKMLPIRVVVPSLRFDKTGIPRGAIPFGESYTDSMYSLPITFEGTSSPITAGAQPGSGWWAKFVLPTNDRQVSEQFYPAGVQLGGATDEDSLYNPVYSTIPNLSGGNGGT